MGREVPRLTPAGQGGGSLTPVEEGLSYRAGAESDEVYHEIKQRIIQGRRYRGEGVHKALEAEADDLGRSLIQGIDVGVVDLQTGLSLPVSLVAQP